MQAELKDFKTGWHGLTLGIKSSEIDALVSALEKLKKHKEHFHLRSEFNGIGGIGDIEFYFQEENQSSNLELENSNVIYSNKNT